MRGAEGCPDDRVLSRMYVEPLTYVNPSLTTFVGSPCWDNVNGSKSSGRNDQECAMNRPSEIPEDKLQAVLALIKRIDEQIGTRSASKAKSKPVLKPRTTSTS
jgi:hypothetical protein